MSILNFNALLALAIIVLLIPVFVRLWRRKVRYASMLGSSPSRSRLHHDIFYITAAILIGFSLLRPYSGFEEISVPSNHTDTLVLLDISQSMLARDLPPTRLDFAKRRIEDLLQLFAKERSGDRIGLIIFAGEAYLYCPLTSDYSALKLFTKSISVDLISSQGTALKEAFAAAANSLENSLAREPQLLLMTDGEDDALDIETALKPIIGLNLPVQVLGIGTPDGRPIELKSGKFLHDGNGKIVVSKLAESNLQALADKTGGRYARASLAGGELTLLLKKSVPEDLLALRDQKLRIYREFGPYILMGLLAVILLLAVVGKKEVVVAALIFGVISAGTARAEDRAFNGYKLYQEGKYKEALEVFKNEYEKAPTEKLLQALASTYYKLGELKESERLFGELSSSTESGKRKFEAEFGLGNSKFLSKDYKGALEHYSKALEIKPDDEPTVYNLELAKKLLEQKEREKEQKQEEQQQEEQKQDQEQKEEQEGQKEKGGEEASSSSSDSADPQESGSSNGEPSQSSSGNGSSSSSSASDNGNSDTQEEDEQEAENESNSAPSEGSGENTGPASSKDPLSQSEADTWLDSLPEAPVLLQSKKNRRPRGGQSW